MKTETLTEYECHVLADFLSENASEFYTFLDDREHGTGETMGDLLIDKLQRMANEIR